MSDVETTNFNPFCNFFYQRVTSGIIFIMFIFSPIIGWPLMLYLLTSRFWWFGLLYLLWLYADRSTPEKGGRSLSWIQHSRSWSLQKSYFSADLTFAPGFNLDSKRNYLFCFFPHGIIPNGFYINIMSGVGNFYQLYPNFKVCCAILQLPFFTPFLREWVLGLGFVSCTAKAISYVLSRPEGRHILCLNTGGAAEAFYSQPGKYYSIVKNRRGFVKMALKNGAPLVPVITFGECDAFYQIGGGKLRAFQEFVRKKLQFAPVVFYGNGFFFKYGLVPRNITLKTVVGAPIDVSKVENPTEKQINELHETYVKQSVNLFETYKYQFLENPNETNLVLM